MSQDYMDVEIEFRKQPMSKSNGRGLTALEHLLQLVRPLSGLN